MMMMVLTIDRFLESSHGTFGAIEQFNYFTCEEEGQGNQRNISRIPEGRYICQRTIYIKHGYETFEVMHVPARSRILFHPGNTEEDSQGCILLGFALGVIKRKDEDTGERVRKLAVTQSRVAFRDFMRKMDGLETFELIIRNPRA